MTSQKKLKRAVRTRMAKTGESYVAARRNVVTESERPEVVTELDRELNILEYVDKYLEFQLHPAQKMVLKTFYGLPLDTETARIKVSNRLGGTLTLTEAGFLSYLHSERRSNVSKSTTPYRELILVAGRGSGKDLLCVIINAYETYLAFRRADPVTHLRYMVCTHDIRLGTRKTLGSVMTCNPSWVCVQPTADTLEVCQDNKKVTLKTQRADYRLLRGLSNGIITLSEYDFFDDPEKVREYALPTLGIAPHAKLLIASSPNPKGSKLYPLFRQSFGSPFSKERLVLQIHTGEMLSTSEFSTYKHASRSERQAYFKEESVPDTEERRSDVDEQRHYSVRDLLEANKWHRERENTIGLHETASELGFVAEWEEAKQSYGSTELSTRVQWNYIKKAILAPNLLGGSRRCPLCGHGLDTDGDGDCASCQVWLAPETPSTLREKLKSREGQRQLFGVEEYDFFEATEEEKKAFQRRFESTEGGAIPTPVAPPVELWDDTNDSSIKSARSPEYQAVYGPTARPYTRPAATAIELEAPTNIGEVLTDKATSGRKTERGTPGFNRGTDGDGTE